MTVRVLLIGIPRMLADVLHDVLHHTPGMVVVDTQADEQALWAMAEGVDIDVALVCADAKSDDRRLAGLAMRRPELVVLGVSPDAREMWRYRVHVERIALPEMSPEAIRDLVRDEVAARARLP